MYLQAASLWLIPFNTRDVMTMLFNQVEWIIVARRKTKSYYSAHDFATRVSFAMLASVADGGHSGVDRTFVGLSQELYWQPQLDWVLDLHDGDMTV